LYRKVLDTDMKHTQEIAQNAFFAKASLVVSRKNRVATGRALRAKIPLMQQGQWKKAKGRPDPIDILRKFDTRRMKQLVPIRYGRMLQSPFSYYRGAAEVMAFDLAQMPNTDLKVQACGDCHLMNFGGFATPERNIIFDVNDFDETLPAPWEWVVKRLAASVTLAARSIGLSDGKARECAATSACSYREHIRELSRMDPLRVWYAHISVNNFIEALPKATRKRVLKHIDEVASRSGSELDYPKLAGPVGGQIRITDHPPLIFHPEPSHAPDDFQEARERIFQAYRETLSDDRRMLLDRYRVVDAAIKVVGVGSVGRRCWIALLMSEENDPLFLQFKEAVESALEPYAGKSTYSHHGQRVVMGQRLMQPVSDIFLGWATAPTGRQFYVRQLHDAKIKPMVETFDAKMLDIYARACGWALAHAHSKVSEISSTISGYLGSSSDEFDQAMGKFALLYADQVEQDYAALKVAVRKGKVPASQEA
jgi:uncharacterized protein (DUF2252 family)